MRKKGAILPFNWLFAIIVGIVILFIAIYATARYIGVSEYQTSTEAAARLDSLLDPLETGLASGKSASINFKKETRTYFTCSDLGVWGKNTIAFSEKTFGDFTEKGGEINTQKYIFSEEMLEGKRLNLFSKPFSMPFKIDDILVITSRDYCFYQAPDEIKDEIQGLNLQNINFADDESEMANCSGIKVCFDSQCEVSVYGMCEDYSCESYYDYGKVFRGSEVLYYTDSLLYAAIMSDTETYDCNLKRLMKRFIELADVYINKIRIIENQGCSSNIEADLNVMKGLARDLETSEDLFLIITNAESADIKNQQASCKLY